MIFNLMNKLVFQLSLLEHISYCSFSLFLKFSSARAQRHSQCPKIVRNSGNKINVRSKDKGF